MDLKSPTGIYGIHEGVYYGQNERVDELNSRIYSRNIPPAQLSPAFSPRPTPTKYSYFPIMNLRKSQSQQPISSENENEQNSHICDTVLESELRNQNSLLQHGTIQNIYIPSSSSELYKIYVTSTPTQQPHPDLFKRYAYMTSGDNQIIRAPLSEHPFLNSTSVRQTMPYSF